jgi:hypothetical protein
MLCQRVEYSATVATGAAPEKISLLAMRRFSKGVGWERNWERGGLSGKQNVCDGPLICQSISLKYRNIQSFDGAGTDRANGNESKAPTAKVRGPDANGLHKTSRSLPDRLARSGS